MTKRILFGTHLLLELKCCENIEMKVVTEMKFAKSQEWFLPSYRSEVCKVYENKVCEYTVMLFIFKDADNVIGKIIQMKLAKLKS